MSDSALKDAKEIKRESNGARMRQKMREGHELPHTEMVESDTTVLDLPLTKKNFRLFWTDDPVW